MTNIVKAMVIGVVGLVFLGFFVIPVCGCSTRETMSYAVSKSDLRNLVTAQEAFYDSTGAYSPDTLALGFSASTGARVEIMVGDSGWSAVAHHRYHPDGRCGIYVGNATNPVRAADEGVPACEGFRRSRNRLERLLGFRGRPLP